MDLLNHAIYSVDGHLKDGDCDAILSEYLGSKHDGKPLAIWVHGGLTDTKSAKQSFSSLCPWLLGETLPGTSPSRIAHPVYPVFPIWETGVGHQIWEALGSVVRRYFTRDGVIRILEAIIGVKLEGLAGGLFGIDEASMTITDEDKALIREAIEADARLMAEAEELGRPQKSPAFSLFNFVEGDAMLTDESLDDMLRRRFDEEAVEANESKELGFLNAAQALKIAVEIIAKIGIKVIQRYKSDRAHALKETIIEECVRYTMLTPEVWKAIKDDAANNFGSLDAFSNAAGSKLIEAMRKQHAALSKREILLVGHSAGSIYLLEFLKAAHRDKLDLKFHVRFLAAAVTYKDVATTLGNDEVRDQIASFRSYGMSDPVESRESLLHGAAFLKPFPLLKNFYVGSLLYMVSGALESEADEPLLGMQRALQIKRKDDQSIVNKVQAWLKTHDDKAFVWSPSTSANPLYQTQADTHGGFGNETAANGCLRAAVIV